MKEVIYFIQDLLVISCSLLVVFIVVGSFFGIELLSEKIKKGGKHND